eukprot:m.75471 g.75471  ORF g.75471 m.75471 type:complete len:1454 (-) comp14582_c0_seq1:396-4757(-)
MADGGGSSSTGHGDDDDGDVGLRTVSYIDAVQPAAARPVQTLSGALAEEGSAVEAVAAPSAPAPPPPAPSAPTPASSAPTAPVKAKKEPVHPINMNLFWPPNLITYLTFTWVTPLISKGYRQALDVGDMLKFPPQCQSTTIADQLEADCQRALRNKQHIVWGYFRTFRVELLWIFFWLTLECGVQILTPVLLGRLVRTITRLEDGTEEASTAYKYAAGVAASSGAYSLLHHVAFLKAWIVGMNMRTASISMIYRKALRMSKDSMSKISSGMVVNMASSDVERFMQGAMLAHFIILAPIQACFVLWLTWEQIGPSALGGVGLLFALTPLHLYMSKRFSKLREKTAKATDERVKMMNETLSGMRVVKMNAWEEPFTRIVSQVRERELANIYKAMSLRAFNMGFYFVSPALTSFISFLSYDLSGNTLTAEKVFSTMALFAALRLTAATFFPTGIQAVSEMKIVFRRFTSLMVAGEFEGRDAAAVRAAPGVVLDNLTCKYGERAVLQNVSMRVQPGQLQAVVGPVGSGKSTLLMALLNEMVPASGTVTVTGTVAYASQEPWIISGTIRDNILFGTPYDAERYNRAVAACQLLQDIQGFEQGDSTVVGERGITLSGGQKARLSLARAVYSDCGVLLLDDPLSAVDTRVGTLIFDECLRSLLKDKVVVLVTHQLQYLRHVSNILVLNSDGSIHGQGTHAELTSQGHEFDLKFLTADDAADPAAANPEMAAEVAAVDAALESAAKLHDVAVLPGDDAEAASAAELDGDGLPAPSTAAYSLKPSTSSLLPKDSAADAMTSSPTTLSPTTLVEVNEDDEEQANGNSAARQDSAASAAGGPPKKDTKAAATTVLSREVKQEGEVTWHTMLSYMMASGSLFAVLLLLCLCILGQGGQIAVDVWLSHWVDLGKERRDEDKNVIVYAVLVGIFIFFAFARTFQYTRNSLLISRNLHARQLRAVLASPVRFFDTNPTGRILNRFAADLSQIDEALPWTLLDCLQLAFMIIGILLLVSFVNPWLFLLSAPLTVIFVFIRRYYIRSAREVKRIEAIRRSPIYSNIVNSLQGLSVIRCHQAEPRFRGQLENVQDQHTESFFTFIVIGRWLAFRLDLLTFLFVAGTAFIAVAARNALEPGTVGLSLVYALQITSIFQWCVRQSAEVETQMTSVERVLEYCALPSEHTPAPQSSNATGGSHDVEKSAGAGAGTLAVAASQPVEAAIPEDWPTAGQVVMRGLYLRYADHMDWTLRSVNCVIKPKEKIGVVGRTGAGKSSLIAALFRLSPTVGDLIIDGLNANDVPKPRWRRGMSVIPQDPVFFSGSVRRNLDPFNESNDADIWKALETVQLKDTLEAMKAGLDSHMAESGSNFSVGQRQLFCLARAVLRKTRILIMDEATANVDTKTDRLIQETIRARFADCTVITIAHRLHTIMDSDRIAVMDKGRIVEFDTPDALRAIPDGFFATLVANIH